MGDQDVCLDWDPTSPRVFVGGVLKGKVVAPASWEVGSTIYVQLSPVEVQGDGAVLKVMQASEVDPL